MSNNQTHDRSNTDDQPNVPILGIIAVFVLRIYTQYFALICGICNIRSWPTKGFLTSLAIICSWKSFMHLVVSDFSSFQICVLWLHKTSFSPVLPFSFAFSICLISTYGAFTNRPFLFIHYNDHLFVKYTQWKARFLYLKIINFKETQHFDKYRNMARSVSYVLSLTCN